MANNQTFSKHSFYFNIEHTFYINTSHLVSFMLCIALISSIFHITHTVRGYNMPVDENYNIMNEPEISQTMHNCNFSTTRSNWISFSFKIYLSDESPNRNIKFLDFNFKYMILISTWVAFKSDDFGKIDEKLSIN